MATLGKKRVVQKARQKHNFRCVSSAVYVMLICCLPVVESMAKNPSGLPDMMRNEIL